MKGIGFFDSLARDLAWTFEPSPLCSWAVEHYPDLNRVLAEVDHLPSDLNGLFKGRARALLEITVAIFLLGKYGAEITDLNDENAVLDYIKSKTA